MGVEINKTRHVWIQNILWYSPLALSVLFSGYCVGVTTADSGLYIKKAFEFTQGKFDLLFRPGFTFLLGNTFKILEPSVWAGMALVRFFFAANVFLIFLMTRYLYNKQVAFAASMTLLFSYYFNFLSHRILLDNVHPFFVLLCIFLSLMAADRKSILLAVGAGVAFFCTYLVKVTTLLFLPFPILIAICWHSFKIRWSNLRQAVVTAGIACVCIVLYHLLVRDGERITQAQHGFGESAIQAYELLFGENLAESFNSAMKGLIGFWQSFLFMDVWLGCLFAASWLWLAIRFLKSNSSRPIIALFILFIPAALYLGLANLRLGQAGVFLFVTFIPVGVLLHDLATGLIKTPIPHLRIPDHLVKPASSVIIFVLTIIVCIYQVWYGVPNSKSFLRDTYLGRKITGKDTLFTLSGKFDARSHKAAQVIKRYAKPEDIVQTGFSNFWAIQFFTGYQYKVLKKGFAKRLANIFTLKHNFADSIPPGKIKGRLLYLWPNGWRHRLTQWNQAGELQIRYVDESTLLRRFDGSKTVFVALDKRWRHIAKYLKMAPGVKRLKSSGDPGVYRVKNFSPVKDFGPPRVALQIGKLLAELRASHPDNYQVVRNKFFPNFFGFKPEQVDAMAELNEEAAGVVFMHGRK